MWDGVGSVGKERVHVSYTPFPHCTGSQLQCFTPAYIISHTAQVHTCTHRIPHCTGSHLQCFTPAYIISHTAQVQTCTHNISHCTGSYLQCFTPAYIISHTAQVHTCTGDCTWGYPFCGPRSTILFNSKRCRRQRTLLEHLQTIRQSVPWHQRHRHDQQGGGYYPGSCRAFAAGQLLPGSGLRLDQPEFWKALPGPPQVSLHSTLLQSLLKHFHILNGANLFEHFFETQAVFL